LTSDTFVASLDVVMQLLADSKWSEKAKKVKTLRELRELLLDFCRSEEGGKIIRVDQNTVYLYHF
jgi:hypothetical protein